MRFVPAALLVLVALMRTHVAAAATTRLCSDPCFQAAKADFRDCVSSAQGAFFTAVDGCLEREHMCVDACRSQRQDCLDGTGAGAGLAECDAALDAEKARCQNRFPPASRRLAICIFKAETNGFRCRQGVRRSFLAETRGCQNGF